MHRKYRLLTAGLALVLATALPQAPLLADEKEAAEMYQEAQKLKREFQYDSARTLFETVTTMEDSGPWGALASDELRYGLPVFEADQLVLKFGRSSHKPKLQDEYKQKAQELYDEVISLNADKPERITGVQQKLDQLVTSASYLQASRDMQLQSALTPLRMSMRERFHAVGKWPDEAWLRTELESVLARARLPRDRLLVKEYYVDGANFQLYLYGSDGNQLKMVGDPDGVRIE